MKQVILVSILILTVLAGTLAADEIADGVLQLVDVFQLEYADDPRISPDGQQIVYVRSFMDIMADRQRSNLWIVNVDGSDHRPLTTGSENHWSPRWSPDGGRLLYLSGEEHTAQVFCRWMDTGQTARLAQLPGPAAGIVWSPNGRHIAFSMPVPAPGEPFVKMPRKPPGAEWAEPAKVITKVLYRMDGIGYLKDMYFHIFVLPADGGTPRQITSDNYHHRDPRWTPGGEALIFSANRHDDWEYEPRNSEVYSVDLTTREITALTDRVGPDANPAISPDGAKIAYLGYDDRYQGHQVTRLYLMNRDGSGHKLVTGNFDRSVENITWSDDASGLFFQYDDQGNTKLGFVTPGGEIATLADDVGGLSLGRPYSAGTYSVADDGTFAFTFTRPEHPADLAVGGKHSHARRVTALNDDLFGYKELAAVEEIRFPSSFDDREIQGWIATPPGFDASKKYPLILEIHGGPFANYGDRFTAEIQLYAAAGHSIAKRPSQLIANVAHILKWFEMYRTEED